MVRSLHFKVAAGVIGTILVLATVDTLFDYFLFRRQVTEELKDSANNIARIALHGLLELAMFGEHPELLQTAIERLGAEQSEGSPPVKDILLLNRSGEVRFSSDPKRVGESFSLSDEGCEGCHMGPSEEIPSALFYSIRGEELLRSVTPIPNRQECQQCHDGSSRLNGVLIVDFSVTDRWAKFKGHFLEILLKTGLAVLFVLAVLGLLMHRLVINRIKNLTRLTTLLGKQRVQVEFESVDGEDEIGRLGASFGRMASELTSSIRELKEQKAYLQGLIDSLQDGLIVVSSGINIEMINRAAAEVLPGEFELGRSLRKTLLSDVTGVVSRTFREKESSKKELSVWNDKMRYDYEVSSSPVWDESGEVSRVIILFRDVTVRNALERQISRAERLASVGQLAAGVAHEINNPMAAITTCAEGLERFLRAQKSLTHAVKTEVSEYLSTIGEAASRCKEITQRLLGLSAEPSTEFERVELGSVVKQVLKLVEYHARENAVEISDHLGADAFVFGEPQKLQQLILNLFLNSLEAVGARGRISVSVQSEREFIELCVNDNGRGIPEKDVDRLFDPFFTTKKKGRGTGLGLALSESIVRQHQGRITIQSRSGEGCKVTVVFPRMVA